MHFSQSAYAYHQPIDLNLVPTRDSESFKDFPIGTTGIPISPHPGAYQVQRKYDIHTGVDLYCPHGTHVRAMESGVVVGVMPFTGPSVGLDHWLPTDCVLIEGMTGVFLYGEIKTALTVGAEVTRGQVVGQVTQVLRKDKGRPMSMVHIELMEHGERGWYTSTSMSDAVWQILRDPTPYLLASAGQGL